MKIEEALPRLTGAVVFLAVLVFFGAVWMVALHEERKARLAEDAAIRELIAVIQESSAGGEVVLAQRLGSLEDSHRDVVAWVATLRERLAAIGLRTPPVEE